MKNQIQTLYVIFSRRGLKLNKETLPKTVKMEMTIEDASGKESSDFSTMVRFEASQ